MSTPDPEKKKMRFQALLKEWGLCQDNLQRHNSWAWQTGAIFIALSLAALWASTQIDDAAPKSYLIVLAILSLSTILIWFFFVFRRARFYLEITRQRTTEIERELHNILGLDKDDLLLHTRIDQEDKSYKTRAKHGLYLFIGIIVFAWIWILILNFCSCIK